MPKGQKIQGSEKVLKNGAVLAQFRVTKKDGSQAIVKRIIKSSSSAAANARTKRTRKPITPRQAMGAFKNFYMKSKKGSKHFKSNRGLLWAYTYDMNHTNKVINDRRYLRNPHSYDYMGIDTGDAVRKPFTANQLAKHFKPRSASPKPRSASPKRRSPSPKRRSPSPSRSPLPWLTNPRRSSRLAAKPKSRSPSPKPKPKPKPKSKVVCKRVPIQQPVRRSSRLKQRAGAIGDLRRIPRSLNLRKLLQQQATHQIRRSGAVNVKRQSGGVIRAARPRSPSPKRRSRSRSPLRRKHTLKKKAVAKPMKAGYWW